MNPDQTNTKPVGPFSVLAGEDLTGKRSRLVILTHDTGVPETKLPTANTADALYQLQEEGADATRVSIERFGPHRSFRVPLKDAVNPGDRLVLADVATAADKGKVRKLPVAAGTYRVLALAREAGVADQNVLCDSVGPFDVVVP
ncbi:MAG: hypothetical protein HZC55_26580 [Verrucomicrobia bacterium]|nr:hypothetical protein [Verrucomicrobiota bacterium]